MPNDPCKECYAHSGIVICQEASKRDIKRIEEEFQQEIKEVRDDVNSIKKFLMATLATTLVTLITIIFGLIVAYIKVPGQQNSREVRYGQAQSRIEDRRSSSFPKNDGIFRPSHPH